MTSVHQLGGARVFLSVVRFRQFLICILGAGGMYSSVSHGAERMYKGNKAFNACKTLPVFSEPRIAGSPIGQLSFGDSVKLQSCEDKYFAPDSYSILGLKHSSALRRDEMS